VKSTSSTRAKHTGDSGAAWRTAAIERSKGGGDPANSESDLRAERFVMMGNFGDLEAAGDRHPGRHREFARHFKVINKILLFVNLHFHFSEIYAYLPASCTLWRGASANRHERWGGMRWT
jgi:hypothetical protein